MQKLLRRRLTDTPRNASLVPCSVGLSLNRPQRVSEQVLSTLDNNPEVNLRQHSGGSDLRVLNIVYVDRGAKAPLSFSNKELVSSPELKTQWFSPEGEIKCTHQFKKLLVLSLLKMLMPLKK